MSKLVSPAKDFSKWYQEVIDKADLAEHSPIKGAMTIKPYGFSIWENLQAILDGMIKQAGVKNVYFPLFVPKSFLEKEAHHVAGFAPEVAWVTKGGGKDLEEPYAVRPTSETIIGEAFSRWIQSYRNLPTKINQWANVVRWEMRPRLFLRTTEFLWQEGHTCHQSQAEAEEEMRRALQMYQTFVVEYLAMHVVVGVKSESEKFAGAETTSAIESLMRDGKALQMGTAHYLGQNFAKVFGISYLDEQDKQEFVHQTSWGVSTRLIGGLIMAHGDDKGLIIPPKIAPIRVVIVPIWQSEKQRQEVLSFVKSNVLSQLSDKHRTHIDDDAQKTPGWKFNEWELKGIPVRIEVGGNEVASKSVTLVRRDQDGKITVSLPDLSKELDKTLVSVQNNLLLRHRQFTADNTNTVNSYADLQAIIKDKSGFAKSGWCGSAKCEAQVKAATSATIRVIPFVQSKPPRCIVCGQVGQFQVLWAKAY
jgi:prolyl-tRNA synthetase